MRFRVENLGPVREADIDLTKDLLVLVGPNNAGKTYVAWSLYGIHHAVPDLTNAYRPWLDSLFESTDHSFSINDFEAATDVGSAVAASFKTQIHKCFATSQSRFEGCKIALMDIHLGHKREGSAKFVTEVGASIRATFEVDDNRITLDIVRTRSSSGGQGATDAPDDFFADVRSGERPRLRDAIQRDLNSIVHYLLFNNCTIFPVERIAIDTFAREISLNRSDLVDELVDEVEPTRFDRVGRIRRRAGRYPWPIRDSLYASNDGNYLSSGVTPFADLADDLERAVLGGRLGLSQSGERQYAPASTPKSSIPVSLSSSVVKSLASLVFYFRHRARERDFIIIDEPELNLHPDNQRHIARFLAKVVTRGFKVMVSTHSEIVLRELNQLIMLSKLSTGEQDSYAGGSLAALKPDCVGVYLFDDANVVSVPVEETGFSVQTIDEALNQLNADEQRLYSMVFADKSEPE